MANGGMKPIQLRSHKYQADRPLREFRDPGEKKNTRPGYPSRENTALLAL